MRLKRSQRSFDAQRLGLCVHAIRGPLDLIAATGWDAIGIVFIPSLEDSFSMMIGITPSTTGEPDTSLDALVVLGMAAHVVWYHP